MKIVQVGVLKTQNKPWWVGCTAECRSCGCKAIPDVEDEPLMDIAEKCLNGKKTATWKCHTQGCTGILGITIGSNYEHHNQ